jgi:hypothetical protein
MLNQAQDLMGSTGSPQAVQTDAGVQLTQSALVAHR